LPLREIEPDPEQPRKTFDEQALGELAASIAEHGLLQPIAVRPRPRGGYSIVAGGGPRGGPRRGGCAAALAQLLCRLLLRQAAAGHQLPDAGCFFHRVPILGPRAGQSV